MSCKRWRLLSQQQSSRSGDAKKQGTEQDESQPSTPNNHPTARNKQAPTDYPALNYKPATLKWPFLTVLTISIVFLVALTAAALATLPSTEESWGLSRCASSGRLVDNFQNSPHAATTQYLNPNPLDEYSEARDKVGRRRWLEEGIPLIPNSEFWPSIGTQIITKTEGRVPQHAPHTTTPDRRPSQGASTKKHKEKSITDTATETSEKTPPAVTRTIVSQKTEISDTPVTIHDGSGSITETITRKSVKSEGFSTYPHTSDVFETVKITVTNVAYSTSDASATRTSSGDDTFQPTHNLSASYFTVPPTTLGTPTEAPAMEDGSSQFLSTSPLISIDDTPRMTVVILDGTNTLTVAATELPVKKEMITGTNTLEVVQGVPAFLLLDSLGSAVATIDVIGPSFASYPPGSAISFSITTSTVTHPVPTLELDTSTIVTTMNIATKPYTLSPTKTMTTASSQLTETPDVKTSVYVITEWQYFVGMFLPTLLSTSISVPIGILERSIKLFHPFHALTRPGGARAAESLLVEPGSRGQMISTIFRRPSKDSFILVLVTAVSLITVVLTPFSSEAVSIQLHGCDEGTKDAGHCAITLGVSFFPAVATLVLLTFMLLALLLIAILLKSWNTGVASNPWSICGIASLSTNPNLRRMVSELPADSMVLRENLKSRIFRIRRWENERGLQYGICPNEDEVVGYPNKQPLSTVTQTTKHGAAQRHRPPLAMRYWVRGLCVVFLCGILALIVYYESGIWVNSFEDFMDSESFGVQFLFTSVGVIVNIFWKAFFDSVAILSPFQMLARGPADAHHSILLTPPLDAFTGLWAGVRRKDGFLVAVAWCTVMSQFLPILLANVPATTVQTRTTNLVCSWMAVAVLGSMIMVLTGSFFVRWPQMPADPSTIIGMMYYVCDSPLIESFEGLSMLEEKERDRKVQMMQSTYALGEIRGVSGVQRIAVHTVNERDRSPESV